MPRILRCTLALAALTLALTCAAQTAEQNLPADAASPSALDSGVIHPNQNAVPAASRRRQPQETVCYTMRSYLMAREARDSDATWLVGYSTCQPSSQYQLRFSQQPAPAPPR
ncbi:MAG TPA: hypothetical protein VLV49_02295 [Terriglobales bacterium]|nr:hypothetical protein [Terriglobales bacterium]